MTVTGEINYTNFYTTMLCLIIKSRIIHLLEQNSDTKVGWWGLVLTIVIDADVVCSYFFLRQTLTSPEE